MRKKKLKKYKIEKPAKFIPGSFSTIKKYETCPLWFYIAKVLQVDEPAGIAADRGDAVHSVGENYLRGKRKTLTEDWKYFKKDMAALKRKGRLIVEEEWAFDSNWKPVKWKSKNVYMRMKLDALYPNTRATMVMIDFKTGKVKEHDHCDQAGLYALGVFLRNPKVKKITVEFWYLDHDEVLMWTFYRWEMEGLKESWDFRLARLNNDSRFLPTPSGLCPPSKRNPDWKGCPYNIYNSGHCKHGERN